MLAVKINPKPVEYNGKECHPEIFNLQIKEFIFTAYKYPQNVYQLVISDEKHKNLQIRTYNNPNHHYIVNAVRFRKKGYLLSLTNAYNPKIYIYNRLRYNINEKYLIDVVGNRKPQDLHQLDTISKKHFHTEKAAKTFAKKDEAKREIFKLKKYNETLRKILKNQEYESIYNAIHENNKVIRKLNSEIN